MNKETLKEELIAGGLRPSYQRIRVLEYMHAKIGHPTADEIYAALLPEIVSLSKATIYNTLNAFVSSGLLRVISMDGIEKRYDLLTHSHGHFKCDRCGAIINFPFDLEKIKIKELSRFKINEKNIYFNGLCPECLKNNQEKE
ncbi:MAG: transcriptional repressor [Anaerolineaceae bacterium]|nr:transcriptional repressor [Anaerolineaceae bacterium]